MESNRWCPHCGRSHSRGLDLDGSSCSRTGPSFRELGALKRATLRKARADESRKFGVPEGAVIHITERLAL